MTMRKTVVCWLRNDLRYHDNEAIKVANSLGDCLLPVYCFDPRHYKATSRWGFILVIDHFLLWIKYF